MPKRSLITSEQFWSGKSRTMTAKDDLDQILVSVVRLPIRFWRPKFFFTGARDDHLHGLTGGKFPHKIEPLKTHPVYAVEPLSGDAGFKVCPCSTKRPFDVQRIFYIRKGCRLRPNNFSFNSKSYILRHISFNIPPSVAYRLRFRGEVPEECIAEISRREGGRDER